MDYLRQRRLPPPFDDGEIVIERPPDVPKDPPVQPRRQAAAGGDAARHGWNDVAVLHLRSGIVAQSDVLVLPRDDAGVGARLRRPPVQGGAARRRTRRRPTHLSSLSRRTGRGCSRECRGAACVAALEPSRSRRRCGLWSAATGCGSAGPATRTSATCGSGVGTRPLVTALVAPEPGGAEARDPVVADGDRPSARRSVDGAARLPITVDLRAHARIAVEGALDAARGSGAGDGVSTGGAARSGRREGDRRGRVAPIANGTG